MKSFIIICSHSIKEEITLFFKIAKIDVNKERKSHLSTKGRPWKCREELDGNMAHVEL